MKKAKIYISSLILVGGAAVTFGQKFTTFPNSSNANYISRKAILSKDEGLNKLVCEILSDKSFCAAVKREKQQHDPYHHDGRKAFERKQIAEKKLTGKVVRDRGTLRVKLKNDSWKSIIDKPPQPYQDGKSKSYQDSQYFEFLDFNSKEKVYIFHIWEEEGYSFLLVDFESGESCDLRGYPYFSPDGMRVVGLRTLYAVGEDHGISIFRRSNGKFIKELKSIDNEISNFVEGKWRVIDTNGYIQTTVGGQWKSRDTFAFVDYRFINYEYGDKDSVRNKIPEGRIITLRLRSNAKGESIWKMSFSQ